MGESVQHYGSEQGLSRDLIADIMGLEGRLRSEDNSVKVAFSIDGQPVEYEAVLSNDGSIIDISCTTDVSVTNIDFIKAESQGDADNDAKDRDTVKGLILRKEHEQWTHTFTTDKNYSRGAFENEDLLRHILKRLLGK